MLKLGRLLRRFSLVHEEVEATIHQVVKAYEKVNPREVTRSASFDQLGLGSLDIVELLVDMEQALNIELADTDYFTIHTVQDAVRVFTKYKEDDTPRIIRP